MLCDHYRATPNITTRHLAAHRKLSCHALCAIIRAQAEGWQLWRGVPLLMPRYATASLLARCQPNKPDDLAAADAPVRHCEPAGAVRNKQNR